MDKIKPSPVSHGRHKSKNAMCRSRSALMNSLLRFVSMYRANSNMPLRMLVGGQFNIDQKLISFRNMPWFSFLKRRNGNTDSFIFSKENMRLLEVTTKIKNLVEVVVTENTSNKERPGESIYHSSLVRKAEQRLAFSEACQTRVGAKMIQKVMEKKNGENKVEHEEKELIEKVGCHKTID